jgi:hypothetical protein
MHRVALASLLLPSLLLAACGGRNPVGPTSSDTLDQFVKSLREEGLTVTVAGSISPEANRFFSVPAQQVRVNDAHVNAFVYATSQDAAADAASISPDAQPSPTTRISWVSTPRFYRREALIVLYVGCSVEILDALQMVVGTPLAVGPTLCRTD